MSKTIKIKKGYDLKLVGEASSEVGRTYTASTYALKPSDFKNITPKLLLREGAQVKAGEAVFFDQSIIHYSPPNVSENKRIVTNTYFSHNFNKAM